ncbi:MAG: acyltransferase [Planctomycetota bacterium]
MDATITPNSKSTLPASFIAGWDSVRGWSAVAVVVLHACVPYSRFGMPGLAWPTRDVEPASTSSLIISAVMWSIELIIMPIFLVMAGYLAMVSMQSGGGWPTIRRRLRRLGSPLVLGGVLVLPLDLYVWLGGWLADGIVSPVKLRSLKFDSGIDDHLWGLSHLWFLPYLMSYITVLGCWTRYATRPSVLQCNKLFLSMLFVFACSILVVRPEVVWGFQHAWEPVLSKWLYSGLFFWLGAAIASSKPVLDSMARASQRFAVVGIMFLIAAVNLGMHQVAIAAADVDSISLTTGHWHLVPDRAPTWTLAFLTAATAFILTLSLLAAASRWSGTASSPTRSLARASMAIYLLHHPVVGLAQVALKHGAPGIPAILKVLLAASAGVLVPLGIHLVWNGSLRRSDQADASSATVIPLRPALKHGHESQRPSRLAG